MYMYVHMYIYIYVWTSVVYKDLHAHTHTHTMTHVPLQVTEQPYSSLPFLYTDSGRNALFMEGKDTFQIQDELSKDNYHLTLSDALISVIEEVSIIIVIIHITSYSL